METQPEAGYQTCEVLTALADQRERQFAEMEERARLWPALKDCAEALAFIQWIRTQPGSEHWIYEALEDGRVLMTFTGPTSLLVEKDALGLTGGPSSDYAQVQEAIFLKKLGRTIYR